MKKLLFFVVGIVVIAASPVHTQPVRGNMLTESEIYLQRADRLFEAQNYYQAAQYYGKVVVEQDTNDYAIFQLAESNRLGRFYEFAELWYKDVADTSRFPLALYWLGHMQKVSQQYDKAQNTFRSFLDHYSKEDYYKKRAQQELQACQMARKMVENPGRSTIRRYKENINTAKSEFSAIEKMNDTLFFARSQEVHYYKVEVFGIPLTPMDTATVTRLYKTPKTAGNYFQSQRTLVKIPLENPNVNIGSPSFGVSTKTLYFTVCPGSYGKAGCRIYKAEKDTQGWTNVQPLSASINQTKTSAKTPHVIQRDNGDTILLFASNRPGGEGGYDLWYSRKENGKFVPPVNLGKTVNTPVDEMSPHYQSKQKRLYFSSQGHMGLGGYDVFKTAGQIGENSWGTIENIGYPLNKGTDDYYFTQYKSTQQAGKKYGFFSSNRKKSYALKVKSGSKRKVNTCCDDIYYYEKALFDSLHFLVTGDIINTVIEKPMDEVELSLFVGGNELPEFRRKNEGNYTLQLDFTETDTYQLLLQKKGFHQKEVLLTKDRLQAISDSLKEVGQSNPYRVKKDIPLYRSTLPNLYYSFKSEKLNRDNRKRLDYIADVITDSAHQEKELLISSHTDNIDSRAANRELSKKRTEMVQDYLTKKGIDSSRLIGQWFGEVRPVAPNQKEDGRDNPEGRAENRRTEFSLTDTTQKRGYESKDTAAVAQRDSFITPENPNNVDPEKQAEVFRKMLDKYGDKTHKDLVFKVQVGAYTDPGPSLLTQILFSLNVSEVSQLETEQTDFGVTRFLVGRNFKKLRAAEQIRRKIVREGEAQKGIVIKDAFIAPYYKGRRILMTDAFEILARGIGSSSGVSKKN